MRIAKSELGFVMLESSGNGLPITLAVALFALVSQRSHMFVVFFMATVAVFGRIFEHGALVAVFALHLDVLAQQGKAAFVVVEFGRFFPTALGVTAHAVFA